MRYNKKVRKYSIHKQQHIFLYLTPMVRFRVHVDNFIINETVFINTLQFKMFVIIIV